MVFFEKHAEKLHKAGIGAPKMAQSWVFSPMFFILYQAQILFTSRGLVTCEITCVADRGVFGRLTTSNGTKGLVPATCETFSMLSGQALIGCKDI